MSDNVEFKVTGLEKLLAEFTNLEDRVRQGSLFAVSQISAHGAENARLNAPIDTGFLRENITSEAKLTSENEAKGIITDEADYALRMHEQLLPYGSGPQNLGRTSAEQPGTPEGGVGGKYIERVINYHALSYKKALGDAINQILPPGANPNSEIKIK